MTPLEEQQTSISLRQQPACFIVAAKMLELLFCSSRENADTWQKANLFVIHKIARLEKNRVLLHQQKEKEKKEAQFLLDFGFGVRTMHLYFLLQIFVSTFPLQKAGFCLSTVKSTSIFLPVSGNFIFRYLSLPFILSS